MEGFSATGQSSGAQTINGGYDDEVGLIEASSFDEAIIKYEQLSNTKVDKYEGDNAKRSKYGIWGCRLFDNELDARKSFG